MKCGSLAHFFIVLRGRRILECCAQGYEEVHVKPFKHPDVNPEDLIPLSDAWRLWRLWRLLLCKARDELQNFDAFLLHQFRGPNCPPGAKRPSQVPPSSTRCRVRRNSICAMDGHCLIVQDQSETRPEVYKCAFEEHTENMLVRSLRRKTPGCSQVPNCPFCWCVLRKTQWIAPGVRSYWQRKDQRCHVDDFECDEPVPLEGQKPWSSCRGWFGGCSSTVVVVLTRLDGAWHLKDGSFDLAGFKIVYVAPMKVTLFPTWRDFLWLDLTRWFDVFLSPRPWCRRWCRALLNVWRRPMESLGFGWIWCLCVMFFLTLLLNSFHKVQVKVDRSTQQELHTNDSSHFFCTPSAAVVNFVQFSSSFR